MFWQFIRIRALQNLGLGKPFQFIILILLVGCILAGAIYAFIIFQAVGSRSDSPHVHARRSL
jgi:hypothetical protein